MPRGPIVVRGEPICVTSALCSWLLWQLGPGSQVHGPVQLHSHCHVLIEVETHIVYKKIKRGLDTIFRFFQLILGACHMPYKTAII